MSARQYKKRWKYYIEDEEVSQQEFMKQWAKNDIALEYLENHVKNKDKYKNGYEEYKRLWKNIDIRKERG